MSEKPPHDLVPWLLDRLDPAADLGPRFRATALSYWLGPIPVEPSRAARRASRRERSRSPHACHLRNIGAPAGLDDRRR